VITDVALLHRFIGDQQLVMAERNEWRAASLLRPSVSAFQSSTTAAARSAVATCHPRSVNENIFHIIGVIAVIVVVLKVLHLF
jgi:hypothetical protein